MKSNFQELKSHYMNYKHIYTDDSKDDIKVVCAVVSDDFSETMRIHEGFSIFTAEVKVRALRDKNRSRANCVPIYGDRYQNLQWSLTFN